MNHELKTAHCQLLTDSYICFMYEVITQSLRSLVDFNDEELFIFMQKLKPVSVKKNTHYLKGGQVCRNMAMVQKGCFRHYTTSPKGEQTLQFFFEGEWIGDYASFLRNVPSVEFVEALEDSEVVTLSLADQQDLYRRSQRFETFGRLIAERLFFGVLKKNQDLLTKTLEERYLALLENKPQIMERVPQHLIASQLGVQPPSLSRLRARLFKR